MLADIKLLLIDVDGVIIRKQKRFYQYLEENGFPNAKEVLDSYYKNDMDYSALIGEADPTILLGTVIENLKWPGDVQNFLENLYAFEEQYVDWELIDLIKKYKRSGRKAILTTDQDQHRKKYLLNQLGLNRHFDGYFVSCDFNSRKSRKEFWEKAIKEIALLGLQIREVLFIDDYLKNIEMAEEFGINGFHAKDEQEICLLKKQLAKYAF